MHYINVPTKSKKYRLIYNDCIIYEKKRLYRIVALIDIGFNIKAGDLGGYIESERNLSHNGLAWVHKGAIVYGHSEVFAGVQVYGPLRLV